MLQGLLASSKPHYPTCDVRQRQALVHYPCCHALISQVFVCSPEMGRGIMGFVALKMPLKFSEQTRKERKYCVELDAGKVRKDILLFTRAVLIEEQRVNSSHKL